MKFFQTRPGARFRYRGEIYRKVSPLKASKETDDSQKLIPRSGEVTLLDEHGRELVEKLPETLSSERIEAALGHFLPECERAAAHIDPPLTESQRTQLQRAVDSAGQAFLLHLAQVD